MALEGRLLVGLRDAGMTCWNVDNQIREATGIQDFTCILLFVPVVEMAGNIIPGIKLVRRFIRTKVQHEKWAHGNQGGNRAKI